MVNALKALGIPLGFAEFEKFLRESIEGREYAKFVFTKSLSQSIEDIAGWAVLHDLTRDDASYLTLEELNLIRMGHKSSNLELWLKGHIADEREKTRYRAAVELPPLITDLIDFDAFTALQSEPNYIGIGNVQGKVVVFDGGKSQPLQGCIVFMPQADPGYDWLFTQGIVGLITIYGGANSHMAIRAAEFGLPAALGVGEQLYDKFKSCNSIILDCLNRQIIQIN
jgi:phosphohistidine swiveling domain-containing protein